MPCIYVRFRKYTGSMYIILNNMSIKGLRSVITQKQLTFQICPPKMELKPNEVISFHCFCF